MLGVVLCGGKSTRLPHKLFLCNRRGRPLPVAAAEMLLAAGLPTLACLNQEDVCLAGLLRHLIPSKQLRIHLDRHEGLLRLLTDLAVSDDLMVVCGDNAYGKATAAGVNARVAVLTKPESLKVKLLAAVNSVTRCHQELDGWDEVTRLWVRRGQPATAWITTPWVIPRGTKIMFSITLAFNALGAAPLVCNDPEWADLGTPEAVQEYYRHVD